MADAPVHEFEKVRFFSDHAETNGAEFEYSKVRSLDYARIAQTASGQPHHQTILAITLADGSKPVDLSTIPIQKIFGQDNYNARADALEAIHDFLAPRTYDYRLRHYLTELKERGYFTYGDKRFYPNGTVTLDGGRTASVTEHVLSIKPYSITIEVPAAKKGWQRVKDFWGSPTIQIVAFTDNDCLMALLKLVYGVSWFRMDDLRFGMAEKRKPGETSRPSGHPVFGSATPKVREAAASGGPTDFRNIDGERVLDVCKALAAHLAEFAAAREQAAKLLYGYGYQMLDAKNPDAIQAFARRLPDAAYLGFSFGLICMLGCVHHPHFPGSDGYQKLRTLVATEMWYRMLDGVPKLVHTVGGEKLSELLARTSVGEVDEAFKNVQQCASLMNSRSDAPFSPLHRALAARTGLWSPDDAAHLSSELETETKELFALGAMLLGVPLTPAARTA